MNTTPQTDIVQAHPSSVDAYVRHGWLIVPIQPGEKGPRGLGSKGWNLRESCITSAKALPHGWNHGLAHAYSGTMALDVDNWDRAKQELYTQGIDLDSLYNAPDAVTIESGRPGHGKLIYAMPLGIALPSKKLIESAADGSKYNYLDFRCATSNGLTVQDVLPSSIHPGTRQPYRWGGRGHWSRLPVIPHTLLSYWQSLIDHDNKVNIDNGPVSVSWGDVESALEVLSPDLGRDDWVRVGMALHWAGTQTDRLQEALYLWDSWSQGSGEKYMGFQDILANWRTFKDDVSPTLGTLFMLAKKEGWTRPHIPVEILFEGVEVSQPEPETHHDPDMPDLIDLFHLPAPDVDLSLWPPLLAKRAEEISVSIGCDPLAPLFAGMAVIAGAADSRTRLQLMPGYEVPPVLWLMTVGNPADKKSPGSLPMAKVLKEIEVEDRDRYHKDKLEWDGQDAAYQAAYKGFIDYCTNAEAQLENDMPPAMPELPAPPVPLKITVQDITSQKLVRHASDRPRGLLCWLDEMAGWIENVVDPRSGENRSTWVAAYEAQQYEYDRVGAGSIWCDNLAVSMYGNVQPKVIRENISRMGKDGLVQRFIPAILRPEKTRRGEPIPDVFSCKSAWDNAVRVAYGLPGTTYTLSEGAYMAFREFQTWYEDTKQEERLLESHDTFMTAFGKLEGQTGRLALVMHLIEDPYSVEVSEDLMNRVIEITKGYIIPSLRYTYGEIGGTNGETLDVWMAQHIIMRSGQQENISMREIRHSARRRLDGDVSTYQQNQQIIDSMSVLESYNWVRQIEHDPRIGRVVWAVNPQLAVTYEDQRVKVLKIKQARLDENMRRTGGKSTKRRIVPGYDPDTMDD